jgi:hypothetical protein
MRRWRRDPAAEAASAESLARFPDLAGNVDNHLLPTGAGGSLPQPLVGWQLFEVMDSATGAAGMA